MEEKMDRISVRLGRNQTGTRTEPILWFRPIRGLLKDYSYKQQATPCCFLITYHLHYHTYSLNLHLTYSYIICVRFICSKKLTISYKYQREVGSLVCILCVQKCCCNSYIECIYFKSDRLVFQSSKYIVKREWLCPCKRTRHLALCR